MLPAMQTQLSFDCGPHCGVISYLGAKQGNIVKHCDPCHSGVPLGSEGYHEEIPPWRQRLIDRESRL